MDKMLDHRILIGGRPYAVRAGEDEDQAEQQAKEQEADESGQEDGDKLPSESGRGGMSAREQGSIEGREQGRREGETVGTHAMERTGGGQESTEGEQMEEEPVSYTHLTLPTIYSV